MGWGFEGVDLAKKYATVSSFKLRLCKKVCKGS